MSNDLSDPLESAKIAAPETAAASSRRGRRPAYAAPSITPVPALEVKEVQPVVAQVVDKVQWFEVQNQLTVSWRGSEMRLRPGAQVSEASHGAGAIDMMRNSGVVLKPIERK